MKLATLLLTVPGVLLLWPRTAITQPQQKPEEIAQKSAETWLTLTDAGKYAESWDEASKGFKEAVTKDTWVEKLQSNRAPLGAVQSRRLTSAKYVKNPPGIPEGEYVVLHFSASFKQLYLRPRDRINRA